MLKNWEYNETEEIGLVTSTPGEEKYVDVFAICMIPSYFTDASTVAGHLIHGRDLVILVWEGLFEHNFDLDRHSIPSRANLLSTENRILSQ